MSGVLRAGFEGSGSPRWLMRTIQRQGFDTARGFRLELRLLNEGRNRHGTLQCVAEGNADVVDGDWLVLAEARASGLPVTAVMPYGQILGTLMLGRGIPGNDISALREHSLGVLSDCDKNWGILRAACALTADFALEKMVRIEIYDNRTALDAALESGAVDAALVHWHRAPELIATGHRVLAEIPDLAGAIQAKVGPTTFFVVHEDLASKQPERVTAFIAAARDAIEVMRWEDGPWIALANELGSGLPALAPLTILRQRWNSRIADIPPWGPDCRRSLKALRGQLLDAAVASNPLSITDFPEGVFHAHFLP
ncbi:MAG: ABC transporter substrate-binding protein [Georgfuchsia sp.]